MQRRTVLILTLACVLLVRFVMRYADSDEELPQAPAAEDARANRVEPASANARGAPERDLAGSVDATAVPAASRAADDGTRANDPAMTRLHAELLGMRVEARDSFLRLAVRDAKLPCDTVNSASALPELPVWRVSCAGAHFYLIRIDEYQDMHVEPILWDAVTPTGERTLELVQPPRPELQQ